MGGALMTSTIDGCCCGEVLRISASSCERIAKARMRHIVYSQVLKDTHGYSWVLKDNHRYSRVLGTVCTRRNATLCAKLTGCCHATVRT
jgi:hypothetical protein